MIRMAVAAVVSFGLFAGCGASIPVKGNTTEVMAITGHWEGEFKEIDSERHGKVAFALEAGRHTAEGKVTAYADASESAAQTLQIQFVKVAGAEVTGTIAPHLEPACNCTVSTEFTGSVGSDMITGFYKVSSADGSVERRGEWTAERID